MKSNAVTTGYIYYGEFTTRQNYDDSAELPSGFELTDEQEEEFHENGGEVYRTADGKMFIDSALAKAHAETVIIPELDEVLELLEKVKVLCETNKTKSPVLETIKDIVSKIDSDGGEHLMAKYYDSTCW